jgi:HAD superfamily hydrolase (TIGR01509 family)
MVKAVLFDFNATLIHSPAWMDLEIRSLPNQAFAWLVEHGHIDQLDDAEIGLAQAAFIQSRRAAEASGHETSHVDDLLAIAAALGRTHDIPLALAEQVIHALHWRCVPQTALIDGADLALNALRERGLRLGIVSNAAYAPFLAWTLEHFGLAGLFEDIVVSADVGVRKPDPRIFEIALERMALSPSQAVYVGDDFGKDVVGSKVAGLRAIWFRETDGTELPDQPVRPDATVSRLIDIPAWASRWAS